MAFELNSSRLVPFPGREASRVRPVLVVLHQENSTPGRIGNALARARHIRSTSAGRGSAIPCRKRSTQHAGAVIFGGPMSANDGDDYVRREIDWIAVPLREQRPFLGICLGAQMLAKQLGASVAPHAQGLTQIGYYPIRPTEAGPCAFPGLALAGLSLASRGIRAARAARPCWPKATISRCRRSASDNAFGLQFHPDVTTAMMHCWTTRGNMDLPGAQPRQQHFEGRAIHDVAERAWLEGLHRRLAGAGACVMLAQAAE